MHFILCGPALCCDSLQHPSLADHVLVKITTGEVAIALEQWLSVLTYVKKSDESPSPAMSTSAPQVEGSSSGTNSSSGKPVESTPPATSTSQVKVTSSSSSGSSSASSGIGESNGSASPASSTSPVQVTSSNSTNNSSKTAMQSETESGSDSASPVASGDADSSAAVTVSETSSSAASSAHSQSSPGSQPALDSKETSTTARVSTPEASVGSISSPAIPKQTQLPPTPRAIVGSSSSGMSGVCSAVQAPALVTPATGAIVGARSQPPHSSGASSADFATAQSMNNLARLEQRLAAEHALNRFQLLRAQVLVEKLESVQQEQKAVEKEQKERLQRLTQLQQNHFMAHRAPQQTTSGGSPLYLSFSSNPTASSSKSGTGSPHQSPVRSKRYPAILSRLKSTLVQSSESASKSVSSTCSSARSSEESDEDSSDDDLAIVFSKPGAPVANPAPSQAPAVQSQSGLAASQATLPASLSSNPVLTAKPAVSASPASVPSSMNFTLEAAKKPAVTQPKAPSLPRQMPYSLLPARPTLPHPADFSGNHLRPASRLSSSHGSHVQSSTMQRPALLPTPPTPPFTLINGAVRPSPPALTPSPPATARTASLSTSLPSRMYISAQQAHDAGPLTPSSHVSSSSSNLSPWPGRHPAAPPKPSASPGNGSLIGRLMESPAVQAGVAQGRSSSSSPLPVALAPDEQAVSSTKNTIARGREQPMDIDCIEIS